MEKINSFFVKQDNNVELGSGEPELHEISIDDIDSLALFATTLDPLPEMTETSGYTAALEKYYLENSDNPDIHWDCYRNLVASHEGRTFLATTIQLELLQKQLRTSGITEETLQSYNNCIESYQRQIAFNQSIRMNNEISKS